MVSETWVGIMGLIAVCFGILGLLALCELASEILKRKEAEEKAERFQSQLEQLSRLGS